MRKIPLSTYRLQFTPAFGFNDARAMVEYLSLLSISHVYASPIFHACKGSTHGYDVVDPNRLNPELGTSEEFDALTEEVRRFDMGWLQDIVPNHMAFDGNNPMLVDVLENGRDSQYFGIFDINWDHPYESIKGRLLAPFLGGFYGETLENGEIRLSYDEQGLAVHYYDLRFPLRIQSYPTVFTYNLSSLRKKLGREHPDFIKFLGLLYVLKTLPSREALKERYDQIKFIKGMLWELYTTSEEIKDFIDKNVEAFNGSKGDPQSFNLLDGLLSEQCFRLSFWKVAAQEINYRRFFSINSLISLKVEDESVFNRNHSLILKLVKAGTFSGLRVDHIDGLYDPTRYLRRLREKVEDIYLVVEKILDLEEELPPFWPVHGTTGYEFTNYVNGLFCRRESRRSFDGIYSNFSGFRTPYKEIVYEKKKLIIERHMTGDVDNLALLMKGISSRDRHGNDITLHGLKRAIVEVLTLFPIYRTYVTDEIYWQRDRSVIEETIRKAKDRNPYLLYELDFLGRFLLLEFADYVTDEEKKDWIHFVMRLQQFTGPLMAKGFEDTTLYVYNRLLSFNEVGGNADQFGIPIKAFHKFNRKRVQRRPHTLNTTSTHDTKRGEDVRARINVLSEIPREWENRIKTWSRINRRGRKEFSLLDKNDEYSLYQTLVGAFPFNEEEIPAFVDRMKEYVIKATREAKVHTAWLKPDATYEQTFISFVENLLEPSEANPFLKEFLPFQRKVARYGIWNSLAQTLIKITAPGIPDIYQGTELWDFSLVDPDNRRPVDYEKRKRFLEEMITKGGEDLPGLIKELISNKEDGRIKLFLIYRALLARKEKMSIFDSGTYVPVETGGKWKNRVVAFARKDEAGWAVTVVPRFLTGLMGEEGYPLGEEIWHDTHLILPDGAPSLWKEAITGQELQGDRRLMIGKVFERFPVALLV